MTRNVQEFFDNRLARWAYTFAVNIGVILVFGGLGYWLDTQFGTKPWIFLVLLLLSFPVSLTIQIRKIKKL